MVRAKKQMRQLRNGLDPLDYLGVAPSSPTNFVRSTSDPTTKDQGNIGDGWLNELSYDVFQLVNVELGVYTWIKTISYAGDVKTLKDDAGTVILPAADGAISVTAGDNTNTTSAANTLHVNLNKSIKQPNTNADGTEGLYSLNNVDFISNYGTDNTFIGGAGNRTLTVATANQNTAIGSGALVSLVDASQDNVAIGFNALGSAQNVNDSVAIGANALGLFTSNFVPIGHNIAIGSESLGSITTSQNNTAVGTNSGLSMLSAGGNAEGGQNTFLGHNTGFALTRANYNTFVGYNAARNQQFGGATGIARQNLALGSGAGWYWEDAESGNISLGSGCIAGESNVTRIGNTPDVIDVPGSLTWPRQTKCLIAGIRGITTDVADAVPVFIDSNGQLGTSSSCAFNAYLDTSLANATGNTESATIVFETELFDLGSNYNVATGVFTAPCNGIFSFYAVVDLFDITIGDRSYIRLTTTTHGYHGLNKNTSAVKSATGFTQTAISALAYMNLGDTAYVTVVSTGEVANTQTIAGADISNPVGSSITWFEGHLVSRL